MNYLLLFSTVFIGLVIGIFVGNMRSSGMMIKNYAAGSVVMGMGFLIFVLLGDTPLPELSEFAGVFVLMRYSTAFAASLCASATAMNFINHGSRS